MVRGFMGKYATISGIDFGQLESLYPLHCPRRFQQAVALVQRHALHEATVLAVQGDAETGGL